MKFIKKVFGESKLTERESILILIPLACLIGLIYSSSQVVLKEIGPFNFVFLRSLLGLVVILLIKPKILRKISFKSFKNLSIVGLFLAGDLIFIAFGLRLTLSGKGALIANLGLLLAPLLSFIFFRERQSAKTMVSLVIGLLGSIMLIDVTSSDILFGDLFMLLSTIFYSFFLVFNSHFSRADNYEKNAFIQLIIVCVISYLLIPFEGGIMFPKSLGGILALIFVGVLITGVRFLVQARAQSVLSPTQTGIVFLLEPVVALFVGAILLSEKLSVMQITGALIIFCSFLLNFLESKALNSLIAKIISGRDKAS